MANEKWEQVKDIFDAAVRQSAEERSEFLDEVCADNETVRREVESLLSSFDRAESFMDKPLVEEIAEMPKSQKAGFIEGHHLAHYEIIERIGAGGMGEVYLAKDKKLDRRVAIKILNEKFSRSESNLHRFTQEAKAASALNHPNILVIHEIGENEETHFIVSEFVEGKTLREIFKEKTLNLSETLEISIQIASALSAAHAANIIHRDIKPENIIVRSDGLVKILDFGLAKLVAHKPIGFEDTTIKQNETAEGMILGTVNCMSPEQAKGERVDARTDIFSLGIVIYEMLTGKTPFAGNSVSEILVNLMTAEPKPLSQFVRDIPEEIEHIVCKMLRKNKDERYQTMKSLSADLKELREKLAFDERLEKSHPSNAEKETKQFQAATDDANLQTAEHLAQKRRVYWDSFASARNVAVLAVLAITIAGALFMWQPWRARQEAQLSLDSGPLQADALTTLPGVESYPSLSPDGNYVVFTWTGNKQDNQDIYVQMIGSGSPLRRTTDPGNDYNPVWSPDGRWIAFLRSPPPSPSGVRNRELRIIPPLGGTERKLADIRSQDFARGLFPDAVYLAWSPDSKSLIVSDTLGEGQPDALFVVSLETGEKWQLTNPQPPMRADTSPAVSPDGNSLVFLRRTSWGLGELHLLPLEKDLTAAGEPKRLTSTELYADYPAWMPDGKEIVFSAKSGLWRLSVEGESAPTRIAYVGEDGMMPAISRSQPGKPARLVYVRSIADSNLWRIETPAPGIPSTSPPVRVISSTKPEYHCQFSPDGSRVAFVSNSSGEPEIWISDPDGTNAVQLTSMKTRDTNCPYWSPDGQNIAFSSTKEGGEFDVYTVPAVGGKPRRLTSHPAIDLCPTFSLDGKWIYFGSDRSGDYRLWKMPLDGGDAIQVTPNQSPWASESADGNLYYPAFSVASPIWRLSVSGGEPVKIADGVVWFNFCLLKKGAYYTDRNGNETGLQYLNFTTGKSTTVARNLGEVAAGLTATPDGKTILFTRVDSSTDDLMLVENFR